MTKWLHDAINPFQLSNGSPIQLPTLRILHNRPRCFSVNFQIHRGIFCRHPEIFVKISITKSHLKLILIILGVPQTYLSSRSSRLRMSSSVNRCLTCLLFLLCLIVTCCLASLGSRLGSQLPLKLSEATPCEKDMLDSHITYSDGDAVIMAQTYKDLTRCHNIHTLNLEIFQAGCVVSPYIDQRAFDFGANARFPDLKSLSLSRYDWNYTQTSWSDRFFAG